MMQANSRIVMSGLVVAAMIFSSVGIISFQVFGKTDSVSIAKIGEPSVGADKMPLAVSLADHASETPEAVHERDVAASLASGQSNPVYRAVEKRDLEEERLASPTESNRITSSVVSNGDGPAAGTVFDAGGPYGGPTCLEGSCVIHFEIFTDDPTLIFFRWDFNDDGVWDTPWSTDNYYDKVFYDNQYGNVKAEGWDGISTRSVILYGSNLGEPPGVQWYLDAANAGWKFKAKETLTVTHLGYYLYSSEYPGLSLRIWDYSSQALLGSCVPSAKVLQKWNWCSLSAYITIVTGSEYMVSFHKSVDNYPYWTGVNNQGFAWENVEFQGFYYAMGMPTRFPNTFGNSQVVPKVDFRWRKVLTEPWTRQDRASLDVRNVSPSISNLTFDSNPTSEGSAMKVTAKFNDPGLEDTWQYRWTFDNNSWTEWREVDKFDGGAKVLLYHSMTNDIKPFKEAIISSCGAFCLTVDDYDFGQAGMNRHLTLDELMAYDVIYVETNYVISEQELAGDLLADYMDQKGIEGSGGVVMGNGPFITNSLWEIRGRYFTGGYSPIGKARNIFGNWNLGAIYFPGHPIMDGVTSLTSYMHIDATTITPGATRIADWTSGRIAAATKLNPHIGNGARSVALPWSAWYNCVGDCVRITVNAIKWASRQNPPVPLPMPIQLPWTSHTYKDDDPVTTSPSDNFTVRLEVKDDDHLRLAGKPSLVYAQDFATGCNGNVFPPGWLNTPDYGWQCQYSAEIGSMAAIYWYYFNDYSTSTLESPPVDLSAYTGGRLEWRQYWRADYGGSYQDGYVELSLNGGVTYPLILAEFHHNQPPIETAKRSIDILNVSNQMKLRYRIESGNDWMWSVDDFRMLGIVGYVMWGLGNTSDMVIVQNVRPTVAGGPTSDTAHVGVPYNFTSLRLEDGALWEETEWFAYMFDFDDGTPTQWVYKGSHAPPKLDVLIIHSLCMAGNSCSDYMNIAQMLEKIDLYGSVTGFNFFEKLTAPTLAYMMNFDVIMFASSWGYIAYPPFDMARIMIGNNLASYLDNGGGGVVTWMSAYDLSPQYGEIFSLLGRYMDQDYGPFEKGDYIIGEVYFPPTINQPSHPVMNGLNASQSQLVSSGNIHSRNLATTAGGMRLASWFDGSAAVGVKDFNNDGRRSCAIGAYAGGYRGPAAPTLLRNCMGWVIGGLPSPDIPAISHTWNSVGTFIVDISVIDDDMGWTWDSVNGVPSADPRYAQTISHRLIQIDVVS